MEDEHSESQQKPWFCRRIRQLRVDSNQKQHEVAKSIGLNESSYANAESASHKRIRLDKVLKLARHYQLDDAATKELVEGWEALPESDYNKKNAKPWAKRDAERSKLKRHDLLEIKCIELTTLLITSVDNPNALCNCGFEDDYVCELCSGLKLLGLRGWTTRSEVLVELAKLQEKLERAPNTGKAS